MQKQIYSATELFGQSIDWRQYISSSGSYPEFGQYDTPSYAVKQSLWQLRSLKLEELQMIGGQQYAGGYEVATQDPIDARDEMVYDGQVFRCVTQPIAEGIGDTLYWKAMFALASATAKF